MPAQMVGHEGRDEIIAVIIAGLAAQGQIDSGVGAGAFEQLGAKLLLEELVDIADVDQQFRHPGAAGRCGGGTVDGASVTV